MTPIDECIQLQRGYNAIMNLWADTLIGDNMTPNVNNYTTEELERLTTLTDDTRQVRTGEFIMFQGNPHVFLRTSERSDDYKKLIRSDGGFACDTSGPSAFAVRRVKSFDDPTELDPPQEVMLAELKRRKEPPISNATHAGRRVRTYGGEIGRVLDPISALRYKSCLELMTGVSLYHTYTYIMLDYGYIDWYEAGSLELLHD